MDASNPDMTASAAALIRRIGTEEFPAALYDYWRSVLPFHQLTAWRMSESGAPVTLAAVRPNESQLIEGLCQLWVAGGYVDDPLFTDDKPRRSVRIVDLEDYEDGDYRSRFFSNVGLTGKLSIHQSADSHVFYVNLYRRVGTPAFDASDAALIDRYAEIAVACLQRHADIWAAKAAVIDRDEMLAKLTGFFAEHEAGLSEREASICAYAVLGYSHEATSLNLDISKSSAMTYRNRAYQKLGATGITDLFSIYMTQA